VTCDRFAWCSLGLAKEDCADQREGRAIAITHHEVVAPRAAGPSGRTCLLALLELNYDWNKDG